MCQSTAYLITGLGNGSRKGFRYLGHSVLTMIEVSFPSVCGALSCHSFPQSLPQQASVAAIISCFMRLFLEAIEDSYLVCFALN